MENEKTDIWQSPNLLWYGRESHSNITFIGRTKEEVKDKIRNARELAELFKKKKKK